MERKRTAPAPSAVSKRKAPTSGTLYIYDQLRQLLVSDEFIVEADESDVRKWSVGISSGTLKQQGQTKLAAQLERWATQASKPPIVLIEVELPADYPISVPFVRVVRPRFKFHTGHVTVGGSICTEVLTTHKWRPMAMETLIRTVCELFREGQAQICVAPDEHVSRYLLFQDYTREEAVEAFTRVAGRYGWK